MLKKVCKKAAELLALLAEDIALQAIVACLGNSCIFF
jgi:hypothetical protein